MALPSPLRPLALAAAAAFASGAHAQAADGGAQTVTVTGRTLQAAPGIAGFGDEPLARVPFAGTVVGGNALLDSGATRLSDLTRLDASLSDAYNSEGYWSYLSVRGFTIDNRFNYRRDGLPINAETAIPLGNKERLEVLKGTSGIQAGTSAPGGLVNLVVKRPEGTVRSAGIEWRQPGSVGAAVDIGQRFGAGDAFGLRVNAAYDHLDPYVHDLEGHRRLLAVAGDWRVSADTLIEAELEHSLQSQPSTPAFSLLGNTLPSAKAIGPRRNLNDQPWSLPVVMEGNTASLRWTQRLAGGWRFTAHAMTQHLTSDDRLAYPFGCSAEGKYDRYCDNGDFDYYDFRSDGEKRRSDALQLAMDGRAVLGGMAHTLAFGVLATRYEQRERPRLDDGVIVGTGNVFGTRPPITTLPALDLVPNTNRDERSTEFFVRDAVQLSPEWKLWAGLRHTRLHRESVRTDGSRATSYSLDATLPWLAVSRQWTPATMVYASWGQGLETAVAPNRALYSNAGEPLPPLKSRQIELGIKHERDDLTWSLVAFQITRPATADAGSCSDPGSCTLRTDGDARHRGLEASAGWAIGPWQLRGSVLFLDAQRRGASNPAVDGQRPTNVPARTLRLQAAYNTPYLPGLQWQAGLSHEGERMVLEDNSVRIPSWTTVQLGARYLQRVGATRLTWRLGVDNAANRRAWRESPFQYGHAYLYPLAPRTVRASLSMDL